MTVDVNKRFVNAAKNGDLETVQTLMDAHEEALRPHIPNAFVWAAGNGRNEVVEHFTDKGIETKGALVAAAGYSRFDIVDFLLDSETEGYPSHVLQRALNMANAATTPDACARDLTIDLLDSALREKQVALSADFQDNKSTTFSPLPPMMPLKQKYLSP